MSGKHKLPVTAAVRMLRRLRIKFEQHPYRYVEGGGTLAFSRETGVEEHQVIKTLILQDDQRRPMIVLMHGDREVSTKALARQIGVKSITPCDPATADRHSGYQVGGTSPFATRRRMPVYCEKTILQLPRVYINGGRRGYSISIASGDLQRALEPHLVSVAR